MARSYLTNIFTNPHHVARRTSGAVAGAPELFLQPAEDAGHATVASKVERACRLYARYYLILYARLYIKFKYFSVYIEN